MPRLVPLSLVGSLLLASAAFAQKRPPDLESELSAVSTGSRPEVDHAISALKHAGAPREAMAAIAHMLVEGNRLTRENAAYVFTYLPEPLFAEAVAKATRDEDEVVRERACTCLGKMKWPAAVRPLATATGDLSPVVRREAVKALGHLGDRSAMPKVLAVLDDTNPDARIAAILALGELKDNRAEPKLVPLLKDASETVRLAAAKSLCALGNAAGKKSVEALLKSEEPSARRDGVRLLEDVRLPWVREAMLVAMRDKDLGVAVAAARVLSLQGDGRGVEWLVLAAERVDPETRLKMEGVLEELRLSQADRQKILTRKPSPGLVLPPAEKEP